MKFSARIKKGDGTEETQVTDAPTRFAVYSQVQAEGATVLAIKEGGSGRSLSSIGNITLGTGIKTEERITFTKNLSAMLSAGLPLSRALSVIERQSANKALKRIVAGLSERVKTGSSFHEALAEHKKIFSDLFISMTKAGEESGTLAGALAVVARQMDRSYALSRKVKGAMIYPSIILAAIFIIGILMLMFVVPTLSATFESLNVALPLSTQIIIGASKFMAGHAILVGVGVIALFTAIIVFLRSRVGGTTMLFVGLHMPVIGELIRETMSARMARSLASLLSSGVDMLEALSISGEVVGKNSFGKVVEEAQVRVRKGESLSATFMEYPKLYPLFVSDMIAVGEETGKVADMLTQVAEYYEVDVEERTKDLSTIIEPLLMLFIGAFVGIFAISMIAPIYSLSSKI